MLIVGQLIKVGALHYLAGGRSLRFQQGHGVDDGNGLGERAHFQLDVHVQNLADLEGKPSRTAFLNPEAVTVTL